MKYSYKLICLVSIGEKVNSLHLLINKMKGLSSRCIEAAREMINCLSKIK